MVVLLLLVFLGRTQANGDEGKTGLRKGRDSYLEAYRKTHEEGMGEENRRKSDIRGSKIKSNGVADDPLRAEYPYPMSQQYPEPSYGAPQGYPNYGPPLYHYGPQAPPHPYYGIPYGLGVGLLGIFDKFKLKLNILTILKLLLKLVLFKKFVSFVGILCLLLFIPWIKAKKAIHHHVGGGGSVGNGGDYDDEDEDDDLMRKASSRTTKDIEKLNNGTARVLESIEKFSEENYLAS